MRPEPTRFLCRPFPADIGTGGRWQISNNGGHVSGVVANGHDLLYQSGDQIMAVGYTAKGDRFVAEKPRVWLAKLGGFEPDSARHGIWRRMANAWRW